MSGRCKACNIILNEDEMTQKWPGTDDYCDLCNQCLRLSDPDECSDDLTNDFREDCYDN
jgi:RNA polymerase subunit RPABC4/transcription elongation factor Spt4